MYSQTWFVAVFTAIPLLMVAGALERRTLVTSSRHAKTARWHKLSLLVGIVGFLAAMAGISFTEPSAGDGAPRPLVYVAAALSIGGLGSMLSLVWHSAWLILDSEPHPDRLKSELRELRHREAELVRRIGESEDGEADES